jgi:uncharacterized membrane protein
VTEAKYAEVIAAYSSNAGTFFATYLTVLSGYLITAFVAGSRLNTLQVAILNTGFIVAVLVMIWAAYHAGMVQVYYTNLLLEIAPDSPQSGRDWVMATLGTLMFGGLVAGLVFMWNVRHPRLE